MKRLAASKSHLGSLDRIKRCVWVGGTVNACTGFRDHPAVINEVSQLFLNVFGEAGEHARVAFGVGGLPFNAPVEVQALFELQ
jgi:enamine deaminase RidA (YjgF/YER057c/UK114 family)